MARLNKPQYKLIVGDDKPFPGGLANGVGNASPDIPWMKCGAKFAIKSPAKKQET